MTLRYSSSLFSNGPYVPLLPEALQEEVEGRSADFSIRLRSLHLFARVLSFFNALSIGPLFLSILVLVIGFAGLVVIALTSSGFAGAVLDRHAYWFMPIWYTTWHLFFLLACVVTFMLIILIPLVLILAARLLWKIPQFFFWESFLPGRDWAITENTMRLQAKDKIDHTAIELCIQRAKEARPSRPVFAKLIFNAIMWAYFLGTYGHFYNNINNTTGHYFCWGLNSFHTADIKQEQDR